jgi:hypothetical protein
MLSLPPELILIITAFLPHESLLVFSLVSSSARQHVLPSLFSDFKMGKYGTSDIRDAYDGLKTMRQEIKITIRQATTCILEANHHLKFDQQAGDDTWFAVLIKLQSHTDFPTF